MAAHTRHGIRGGVEWASRVRGWEVCGTEPKLKASGAVWKFARVGREQWGTRLTPPCSSLCVTSDVALQCGERDPLQSLLLTVLCSPMDQTVTTPLMPSNNC